MNAEFAQAMIASTEQRAEENEDTPLSEKEVNEAIGIGKKVYVIFQEEHGRNGIYTIGKRLAHGQISIFGSRGGATVDILDYGTTWLCFPDAGNDAARSFRLMGVDWDESAREAQERGYVRTVREASGSEVC